MRALRSAACSFWLNEPWSSTRMPNVVCPTDVTALIVNHACFPIVVSDPTILTLVTASSESPAIGLDNAMTFAQARLSGRLPLVTNRFGDALPSACTFFSVTRLAVKPGPAALSTARRQTLSAKKSDRADSKGDAELDSKGPRFRTARRRTTGAGHNWS
jgi:hypothetical protein